MALEIKCKLVAKLQVQKGNSARGAWSKQDFIVETQESYPRKICMNVWGEDKVAELAGFKDGETLTVSVNIESREFNGRWYTDIRAWKIQKDLPAQDGNYQQAPASDPFMSASDEQYPADEGDLPF